MIDKQESKGRFKKIYPILKRLYPNAKCSLDHSNPLELMISTILAAQCTDVRVNIVAKTIYKKYKTAKDWADAPLSEIEKDIRSTGFYRNKSKSVKNACKMIIKKFSGEVPGTMEELLELPGVGRKTANVILGVIFGKGGIICDTHMIRLSRRLGLSEFKNPVKLEFDLAEIISGRARTGFSHCIVFHGRAVCAARKPKCEICKIAKYCPSANEQSLW